MGLCTLLAVLVAASASGTAPIRRLPRRPLAAPRAAGAFDFAKVQPRLENATAALVGASDDYVAVAILGDSGSGKSTLLNVAFGAQFPVDDRCATEGCSLDLSPFLGGGRRLVVMDSVASGERGGERAAMIAAAVADVVVLNLWAQNNTDDVDVIPAALRFIARQLENSADVGERGPTARPPRPKARHVAVVLRDAPDGCTGATCLGLAVAGARSLIGGGAVEAHGGGVAVSELKVRSPCRVTVSFHALPRPRSQDQDSTVSRVTTASHGDGPDEFLEGAKELRLTCLRHLNDSFDGFALAEVGVPLCDFGRFVTALWDVVDKRLRSGLATIVPGSSLVGEALEALCFEDLLQHVLRLDSKVSTAARHCGPLTVEFGAEAASILEAAALCTASGVRSTTAPADSPRRVTGGLPRRTWLGGIRRAAARACQRPRRSRAEAPGSGVELDELPSLLSSRLVVAMEPTLRRHAQHVVSFVMGTFDHNFGAVVALGDCGPKSRFSNQANSFRRRALASFDDAALAAIPPALAGRWSLARERDELCEALDQRIEDRRTEADGFDPSLDASGDGDDVEARTGLRRWWHRQPRLWRVVIVRMLPLVVNYIQGMHSLAAKRRAAVRQEAILPMHPLF